MGSNGEHDRASYNAFDKDAVVEKVAPPRCGVCWVDNPAPVLITDQKGETWYLCPECAERYPGA